MHIAAVGHLLRIASHHRSSYCRPVLNRAEAIACQRQGSQKACMGVQDARAYCAALLHGWKSLPMSLIFWGLGDRSKPCSAWAHLSPHAGISLDAQCWSQSASRSHSTLWFACQTAPTARSQRRSLTGSHAGRPSPMQLSPASTTTTPRATPLRPTLRSEVRRRQLEV